MDEHLHIYSKQEQVISSNMQFHSIVKNTVHLCSLVETFSNQILLKHKPKSLELYIKRQVGTLLGNYKWPTVKLMNYMPVCHNLYLTPDCSRSSLF